MSTDYKGRASAIVFLKKAAGQDTGVTLYARQVHALVELVESLEQRWFTCCHPAWPDPLPHYDGPSGVARHLREHPHPDQFVICYLQGARREYKGNDLHKLLEATP